MSMTVAQCPFASPAGHVSQVPSKEAAGKHYVINGGPKGLPLLGMMIPTKYDPLNMLVRNARKYGGDIIPFRIGNLTTLQINHPDLIWHVFMENHKLYNKGTFFVRFEPAVGEGLLTSNGEKWRRDRQTIQPVFKREQIEGYYFNVVSEVTEKYKRRWLALTEKGPAEINISHEMSSMTMEIVLKTIFGRDNLSQEMVKSLNGSYSFLMGYMTEVRTFPTIDLESVFHTFKYRRFRKELNNIETVLSDLIAQYRREELSDKYNMLALLIEAQKEDPEHFTEKDIRDQAVTMAFAGFETTSIVLQWMWYALDTRPDIADKARAHIAEKAPGTVMGDSSSLEFDELNNMHYLDAVIKETMRLYPPFWATPRQAIENDRWGDYKVERGTVAILPQITMHRHPRFWEEPNAFIPERFLPENEKKIPPGLYFPFSLGPRKCIGQKFAEMEIKVIFAKLLPLFHVTALNVIDNDFDPAISLRIKNPLQVSIRRV